MKAKPAQASTRAVGTRPHPKRPQRPAVAYHCRLTASSGSLLADTRLAIDWVERRRTLGVNRSRAVRVALARLYPRSRVPQRPGLKLRRNARHLHLVDCYGKSSWDRAAREALPLVGASCAQAERTRLLEPIDAEGRSCRQESGSQSFEVEKGLVVQSYKKPVPRLGIRVPLKVVLETGT